MPDPSVLCIGSVLFVFAGAYRRELVQFVSDCSDGNVERLERERIHAEEARWWLQQIELSRATPSGYVLWSA